MTGNKFDFNTTLQEDSIFILFCTKKLWQIIASITIIMFACIGIITFTEDYNNWLFRHTIFFKLLAIVFFIILVILLLFILRQLQTRKPAIIINRHGIIDHSGYLSNGLISWTTIQGFKLHGYKKSKGVIVLIDTPFDYIQKRPHWLKRQLLNQNLRKYGSPIYISTDKLNISTSDLYKQLERKRHDNTMDT